MASEATYLSWNPANWITVILMVGVGFALIGLGLKFFQSRKQASQ